MSKKIMWICCGAMVLAGGYFLWTRGYQNVLGYAMLLLCPLSHLLMHRGHGHDHQEEPAPAGKKDETKPCH